MSETLIPTFELRRLLKEVATETMSRGTIWEDAEILQQKFNKPSGGYVWKDVPKVDED